MKQFLILSMIFLSSCGSQSTNVRSDAKEKDIIKPDFNPAEYETAVFASGCFWCVEAIFESVTGVAEVVSGYAGGSAVDATYDKVSAGITNHAESVMVYYDPELINYNTLLKVFFGSHDPTTLNRQGPDRGRQYRSTIFYKNEEERIAAESFIKELTANKIFPGEITTTLEKLEKFYPAEDYHQDYEKNNPDQPYVKSVSIPRLKRFQSKFPELLKDNSH